MTWGDLMQLANNLLVPALAASGFYLRRMKADLKSDIAEVKDDVRQVKGAVDVMDTRLTTATTALTGHEKLDELRHAGEQRERDLLVDRMVETTRRVEFLERRRLVPATHEPD